MSRHRLVLIGGGFVGTWLATHAGKEPSLDVTLISEESCFTFSPLLINNLAGELAPKDFTLDLTMLAKQHGFTFIQGKVELIDREARTVKVASSNGSTVISYDSAVLGTGATTNFFGIEGMEQQAFSVKRLADVDRMVKHLEEVLVAASKITNQEKQKAALSFIIVGGGPTGVETLGAIKTRLGTIAKEHQLEEVLLNAQFTIVESNTLLFYGFPAPLSEGSRDVLTRGGVTLHCATRVLSADKEKVTLPEDETLPYGTLIWAAGVKPVNPPIQPAFPPGPLVPDAFLRLDEHLFGAGDTVVYEQDGKRFPKNAQSALHMSQAILKNIVRIQQGLAPLPPKPQPPAALVTVLDTGFFRFGNLVLKGRWVHLFRKWLYRFRLWQIKTGN